MGLDIAAYKKLTKAPDAVLDADGWPVDYNKYWRAHPASIEFAEANWPGRAEGIEPGVIYAFADQFRFRAGSYGGYNAWRDELARFIGRRSAKEFWDSGSPSGSFSELIDFADNEGVIGPVVAAKLAKDFADNQTRADAFSDAYWRDRYGDWRKAFTMAADNGAVDFR